MVTAATGVGGVTASPDFAEFFDDVWPDLVAFCAQATGSPGPLRDVVLLHYWADLPVADVARLVRRPEGTVKRRLHEARRSLALTLGEDLDACADP